MIKTLGFADIMAGFPFLASAFHLDIPLTTLILYIGYLIIKGFIFMVISFDVGSILDTGAGILLFLTLFFSFPFPILICVSVFLILKGGFSVLS